MGEEFETFGSKLGRCRTFTVAFEDVDVAGASGKTVRLLLLLGIELHAFRRWQDRGRLESGGLCPCKP